MPRQPRRGGAAQAFAPTSPQHSLGPTVPALLALLDVPVEEAAWQALDPLQRRQQTLEAVKRLLLRESEAQPLVVVFEDLHWIDGETQTLLDSLVESLPAARLLLLVNYRPEYRHAWGGKSYYRQLRIDPLPPESADALLDALLGADPALGPLKRLLVARTEANPLFLEESVRALVETGALAGERGAYRLTQPVEQLKLPATVQAILAARIGRGWRPSTDVASRFSPTPGPSRTASSQPLQAKAAYGSGYGHGLAIAAAACNLRCTLAGRDASSDFWAIGSEGSVAISRRGSPRSSGCSSCLQRGLLIRRSAPGPWASCRASLGCPTRWPAKSN